VFYTGANQTFDSGDNLTYGARGEVAGSSSVGDGTDDQRVAVQFPGNSEPVGCMVSALTREPPPVELPGGWHIGDRAIYTGDGRTFPDGAVMVKGLRGEIVGPCDEIPGAAAVLFPGHKEPVITENLSKDFLLWRMCSPCVVCCRDGPAVPISNNLATSGSDPKSDKNSQNGVAV